MGGAMQVAGGRIPFTLSDQDDLARFLATMPSDSRMKPSTHKKMAEHHPGHTWQSWMDHYKRTGRDVVDAKINRILQGQRERRIAKSSAKLPSGPKASRSSRPSAAEELEAAASESSEDEDARPERGQSGRKVAYTQEDYQMLVEAVVELRRTGGTKTRMYEALAEECPLHSAMSWQTYHSGHRANVEAAVEKRTEQLAKEKKQRAQDRRAKAVGAAEAAVVAGKGKQREDEPAAAPSVPFTAAEDEMLVSKAAGALVDGMLQSTVFTFLGIKYPHHSEKDWKKRWHDNATDFASKVAAKVVSVTLARKAKRDAAAAGPGTFVSKKSVMAPNAYHDPAVVHNKGSARLTPSAVRVADVQAEVKESKREVAEVEEESNMDDADEIDELEDDSIPSVVAPSTASTSQSQRQLRLDTATAAAAAASGPSLVAPSAPRRSLPFPSPTPVLPAPDPALLPPPHLSPADPSPPTPNATPPRSLSAPHPHGSDVGEDDREVIEATPDHSPVGDEMEVDAEVPSPFLRNGTTYALPTFDVKEEIEDEEEEGSIDDRRIESQLVASAQASGWDPLDPSEQALLRNFDSTVQMLERREEEAKEKEARDKEAREKKDAEEEQARIARLMEQVADLRAREWEAQELAMAMAKEREVARQVAEAREWANEVAHSKARKYRELAAEADRMARIQADARRLEEQRERRNAESAQAAIVAEAQASRERQEELEREAAEMMAIIDAKARLEARADELQRRHAEAAAKEQQRIKTASSPLVSHKRRHVELEETELEADEDDHRDKKERISKRPAHLPGARNRPPTYPAAELSRQAPPPFPSPVVTPSVPLFLPADDSSSPRDAQVKPRIPTSALAARAALSNRSSRVLSPPSIPLPAPSPDIKPRVIANLAPRLPPSSSPRKPLVNPPSFVVPRHSTSSVTPAPIAHTLPAPAGPSLRDILVGYAQEYGLKRKQVINLYFSCSATTNLSILTSALQFFTSTPESLSLLPRPEELTLRRTIDRYVWRWEEDEICLGDDEERKREIEVRKGRKSVAARVKFLKESGKETVESLGQKSWPW